LASVLFFWGLPPKKQPLRKAPEGGLDFAAQRNCEAKGKESVGVPSVGFACLPENLIAFVARSFYGMAFENLMPQSSVYRPCLLVPASLLLP
jgi:hypothetical protein